MAFKTGELEFQSSLRIIVIYCVSKANMGKTLQFKDINALKGNGIERRGMEINGKILTSYVDSSGNM